MARTSNRDKAIAYAAEHDAYDGQDHHKTRRPRRAMNALDTLRTTLNAGPTTPPRPRRHDQHNEANVWVCECCALWIENGDDSSCRDYYNHTHPRCNPAIAYLTGPEHRVGYLDMICNGCGTIQHDGANMYSAIRQTN